MALLATHRAPPGSSEAEPRAQGEASLLFLRPEGQPAWRAGEGMWAPGTESRCPPPPAMWSAPCRLSEPNLYLHPLLGDPVPTNKLGVGGQSSHSQTSWRLLGSSQSQRDCDLCAGSAGSSWTGLPPCLLLVHWPQPGWSTHIQSSLNTCPLCLPLTPLGQWILGFEAMGDIVFAHHLLWR